MLDCVQVGTHWIESGLGNPGLLVGAEKLFGQGEVAVYGFWLFAVVDLVCLGFRRCRSANRFSRN
jgi:hypothetical protein